MKLKPEEAVIGSKQILNYPTIIKQPYFAWSDRQQVMLSQNSGIAHAYQHMRAVMPWTKASITHINFFQDYFNYNTTSIQLILQYTITIVCKRPVYSSNQAFIIGT